MSEFIKNIKSEVEESNIRMSFEDDNVFACEIIDKLISQIETSEKGINVANHIERCGCTYCN